MAFWGVKVKPRKPYVLNAEDFDGRIHVTHATLGSGIDTTKSTLQCQDGKNAPIYLCTLFPGKTESCPLHLEFEDYNNVTFSVIGPRSVHLSGFIIQNDDHSDYSSEEDISESDTEDLSEYSQEDRYDDSFMDGGYLDNCNTISNKGVVIEEIFDVEEVDLKNDMHGGISGNVQLFESDDDIAEHETVTKTETDTVNIESEDEDGFPILSTHEIKLEIENFIGEEKGRTNAKKKRARQDNTAATKDKLSSENDIVHELEMNKKMKKIKRSKEAEVDEVCVVKTCDNIESDKMQNNHSPFEEYKRNEIDVKEKSLSVENINMTDPKKAKKKKKKAKKQVTETALDAAGNEITGNPPHTRTFGNGLVVEILSMGKSDEKKASPGKKIGVRYIGKLKKNGQIFDSNIGKAPFKFILGVNQVIKGWDIGVSGMRIGDKRRLTIPPEMGYGNKKVGPIPAGSWLIFDVELVEVR